MNNIEQNKLIDKLKKENEELKKKIEKHDEYCTYLHWFYGNELNKIDYKRFLRLNYYYLRYYGSTKYFSKVIKGMGEISLLPIKRINRKCHAKDIKKELKSIVKRSSYKKIFIFYPGYDWNMKMYQRPQHMAMHFSDKDILFFYCTINCNEKIDGFKQIKKNLYVTNQYELLKNELSDYVLYMPANVSGCYLDELEFIRKNGNKLLYEYIDDLHEDLTDVPKALIQRHEYVLKDDSIPVVITADNLYRKAKKLRGSDKNLLLSTNGVVYDDFHILDCLPIPEKIQSLVKEKKPIIGYYGALASWFDYELVIEIAKKHPDWNILLIGIDYDSSLKKYDYFKNYKNVLYIGPVEYKELVKYGNCCNVLTIPFLINEITLSTSPVKVFEYMSMEKPIVTTDLPECRKYKSVLIGKNHDDFIKKLELALECENDNTYKEILRKEALENTWDKKVEEILSFTSIKGDSK